MTLGKTNDANRTGEPKRKDLNGLPRWSLVALAARSCLREPQILSGPSAYFFRSQDNPELLRRLVLLRAADSCAAAGIYPDPMILEDARRSTWHLQRSPETHLPLGFRTRQILTDKITAPDLVISAAGDTDVKQAKQAAIEALNITSALARLRVTREAIIQDIQKVERGAKAHKWTDDTPVSIEFFATHSDFTRELSLLRDSGLELVTSITPGLIDFVRRNPQAMYGFTSRQFEEFVGKLFSAFGYEVELTAPSRDKGRDIIAIRRKTNPIKLIIECKRYHPSNTVSIGIVQRLYGVTHLEKADRGILATTSYFSKDAKAVLASDPLRLEGRDYAGLIGWLKDYEQWSLGRKLE